MDDNVQHGLTCQVEVLQRSLRSHQGVELRAESAQAVVRPVDLTLGGCDVVRVCDGGASVNVLNLHGHTHTHKRGKKMQKRKMAK